MRGGCAGVGTHAWTRKISDDPLQFAASGRTVSLRDPFIQLGEGQPSRGGMLSQLRNHVFALIVARANRWGGVLAVGGFVGLDVGHAGHLTGARATPDRGRTDNCPPIDACGSSTTDFVPDRPRCRGNTGADRRAVFVRGVLDDTPARPPPNETRVAGEHHVSVLPSARHSPAVHMTPRLTPSG